MHMKIKISEIDVLKGKFSNTISAIEGVLKESEGDIEVGQSYSAEAVYSRTKRIKEVFEDEIKKLSMDITLTIDESTQPE